MKIPSSWRPTPTGCRWPPRCCATVEILCWPSSETCRRQLAPVSSADRLRLLYSDCCAKMCSSAPDFAYIDGWFRLCKDQELVIGNFPQGEFPWEFPTHGHSDLTGFAWLHDRREILVDRGRNRYTPDEVSLAQISAAGHNVPTINDLAPLCESVAKGGSWLPRPYAEARLRADAVADGIALVHDGFARATPVHRHTRRIELKQSGLQVIDIFEGREGRSQWLSSGTSANRLSGSIPS